MPRRANALLGFPLIDYFQDNPQNHAASGPRQDEVYAIDRRPADSIETSVGIADNESIDLIRPEAVTHVLGMNAKRG